MILAWASPFNDFNFHHLTPSGWKLLIFVQFDNKHLQILMFKHTFRCQYQLSDRLIKQINPLTAGAAYIRVFIFYQHIKYHLLNMLKIKYDINQQYL